MLSLMLNLILNLISNLTQDLRVALRDLVKHRGVSTFIALYTYGYRNVYELAPLLDVRDTRLVFERGDEP